MTAQEQAQNYELLKISIKTLLKAYQAMVIEFEAELKDYIKKDFPSSIIQLKENHIFKIKGKIEVLTDLNKK